jgi:hypothetical protein
VLPVTPLVNGNGATKQQSAPTQILDEALEENDVRIVISVDVHGRKSQFAKLQMDRTVFEGLQDQHRGMFFQALENVLEEIQRAVGFKLNSKLDAGRKPDKEKGYANGDYRGEEHLQSGSPAPTPTGNGGEPPLITKPIPLYSQKDDREISEFLRIHRPSEMNSR